MIIGAGIVGASCAYYLSRRGAKVTILERHPQAAMGSTAKSAAGIRHQFSHPENVRMSLYSAGVFSDFEALTGTNAAYRRVGYLFLLSEALLSEWDKQVQMQQALGVRVELLRPKQLSKRFPYLEPDGIAAGSYGIDDGVLDPNSVTMGFLSAARQMGAQLELNTEVLGLAYQSAWKIETTQGELSADAIINAAGAFGGELAKRAGLNVPVLPYRRNIYATGPEPDFPHPSPLIVDMTTGVYTRSEGERFIFGLSNPDESPGADERIDWDWLEHSLELALPRFPFLRTLDRKASWAGLYEITPDHLPILGRMPGAENFFNACGFSGHGVQHAPATGLILAEEILDAQAHSFDITDFRLERFSQPTTLSERNIV